MAHDPTSPAAKRLASALRENLKRRKEQARARSATEGAAVRPTEGEAERETDAAAPLRPKAD